MNTSCGAGRSSIRATRGLQACGAQYGPQSSGGHRENLGPAAFGLRPTLRNTRQNPPNTELLVSLGFRVFSKSSTLSSCGGGCVPVSADFRWRTNYRRCIFRVLATLPPSSGVFLTPTACLPLPSQEAEKSCHPWEEPFKVF